MEKLESVAGLILAGEILWSCDLQNILERAISWSNVLVSMFYLLVQGRLSFEEIDLFRHNGFFQTAFDLTFAPVEVAGRKYIPINIDVSVMDNSDSQKEGVGKTYMLIDSYAPIFSYIGTEGYMLDRELRPGSQHYQKGTPGFIKTTQQTLENLDLSEPLLFRLDGGNDGIETMIPLVGKNRFFLIKRNLRKKSREAWLEYAQVLGTKRITRPGKVVYTGTVTKKHPKADPTMGEFDIVFQVTERTIDREGNELLFPDIEVETWWTNLFESPEDIIALYHNHGTCEQFHSELKSDMGIERLPSDKFSVNALLLKCKRQNNHIFVLS